MGDDKVPRKRAGKKLAGTLERIKGWGRDSKEDQERGNTTGKREEANERKKREEVRKRKEREKKAKKIERDVEKDAEEAQKAREKKEKLNTEQLNELRQQEKDLLSEKDSLKDSFLRNRIDEVSYKRKISDIKGRLAEARKKMGALEK